jgi:3-dehydroquinate dehydratase-2
LHKSLKNLFLQKQNTMKILILNGPNLNLLGKREPEIYGHISFEEYLPQLRNRFSQHEVSYQQSNHEGVLIDTLQEADGQYDAVVINPGGYAHTSIALADCIRAIGIPVVEVHISDISKREPYRRHSFTAEACVKCITGLGMEGYAKAILALEELLGRNPTK